MIPNRTLIQQFALRERNANRLQRQLARSNAWLRVVDRCVNETKNVDSFAGLALAWAAEVTQRQGYSIACAFRLESDELLPLAVLGPKCVREAKTFRVTARYASQKDGAQLNIDEKSPFEAPLDVRNGAWCTIDRDNDGIYVFVVGYDARTGRFADNPSNSSLDYLRMTGQHVIGLWGQISTRQELAKEHDHLRELNMRFKAQDTELRHKNRLLEERSLELEGAFSELNKTQSELVHSERLSAIGQVAAGVAHEVNNPATYVLSDLEELSELIDTEYTGETRRRSSELVAGALHGLHHIVGIIRELGRFSRTDNGEHKAQEVCEAIETVRRLAGVHLKHTARLQVDIPDPSPQIKVSGREVAQILLNLVLNAVQAMEGQSQTNNLIAIQVTQNQESWVDIDIRDNGPGIPGDFQDKIFTPFATTKGGNGGTGLGLSIAMDLARRNGGTLQLVETGGSGTCFRLRLPVFLHGANPACDENETKRIVRPLRVLLVDDCPRVLRAHERKLKKKYLVETALGGKLAWEKISKTEYDLVLCDLMMPEISGLELRNQVVDAHPEYSKRFLFVSGGVARESDRIELERLDLPMVRKPIELKTLGSAIDALGARQARLNAFAIVSSI